MQVTFSGSAEDVVAEMRVVLAQHAPVTSFEPKEILLACQCLVRGGEKVPAIRLYRACFNVGLLEAKQAVEKLPALPRF